MVVLVADEDALAGAPHAVHDIVLFEALEAREHRGVFFGLRFLGAKGVVGEGIQPDGFGLVAVEALGEDGRVRGLQSDVGDGRHREILGGCRGRQGRFGDADVGVAGAVGAAESINKAHFGKGGEQPAVTNAKAFTIKLPQKSKMYFLGI